LHTDRGGRTGEAPPWPRPGRYIVADADPEASSGIPAGTFPGTLARLLDAARYRRAALANVDHVAHDTIA
jgi:hypothetical protein